MFLRDSASLTVPAMENSGGTRLKRTEIYYSSGVSGDVSNLVRKIEESL